MKRKYLKIGVPPECYATLSAEADRRGLCLAELIRERLSDERKTDSAQALITRIEHILVQTLSAVAPALRQEQSVVLTEILLLARELAAERNAQILSRVAQKLDTQFGKGRSKV
jgi:hypothetical protein